MRHHQEIDLPDLRGAVALITGASDGIGLRIASRLAGAGADLILPVRNPVKGTAAAETIRATSPHARIDLPELDLSSLDSVAALATGLLDRATPIHLLINNAGVMQPPHRRVTSDGFELQLGVNHLAHFALTAQLMPLLQEGRARVVSQTSVAARRAVIDWDDPNWERSYDVARAYAQSKLAIGLLGVELGRRSAEAGWGITSAVSHPGVAPTSLLAARPEIGRAGDTAGVRIIRFLSARGVLVGTPESAAEPALMAATTPTLDEGTMYAPVGAGQLSGAAASVELFPPLRRNADANRMWELSARLTGVAFD
ncbi:SDR family oxidoreductase [Schumannella soli]|uniref:SDR family NAD(P)-dependent oxidoreductase n=1 Tax=Schumannella soli TaxID=2590779 RepID=A0A506XZE6_9MICO|nr:SDR family oxidoreductase [Schumannella soli]TPW75586.1 SDR family NAD(P)-dependent oxidoreductase [Schumannella soli]